MSTFADHFPDLADQLEKKKEQSKLLAVFPCVLHTVAVFNKTSPIVIGVDVTEGQLKVNTPIATVKTTAGVKEIIPLGRVYVIFPFALRLRRRRANSSQ